MPIRTFSTAPAFSTAPSSAASRCARSGSCSGSRAKPWIWPAAWLALLWSSLAAPPLAGAEDGPISGHAVIRGKTGATEIVITTTDRLAGAVDSLTWNGKEFIDSHDHGRQLQSAASFDAGSTDPFWAERYNPTEAGSRADGAGNRSTSRLKRFKAGQSELSSTVQMAFWLAPGEASHGRPAINRQPLSEHLVSKRIRIGAGRFDHVIAYDVSFEVPAGETHRYAQFEALTGYMPAEFSTFWCWQPHTGQLQPLSDGPGEQPYPVILSTADRQYAMGIICPQPAVDTAAEPFAMQGPGYGRFRFQQEQVVKWNCVFRLRSDSAIPAGQYSFAMFVVVGTLQQVAATFQQLAAAN